MEWIKNLKISNKLMVLISIALLFVVVVGSVGFYFVRKSCADMTTLYNDRVMPIVWFRSMTKSLLTERVDLTELMLSNSKAENRRLYQDIHEQQKQSEEYLEKYAATKLDPFEKECISKYKDAVNEYVKERDIVINLAMQNKNAAAYAHYQAQKFTIANIAKIIGEAADYNEKVASDLNKQNDKDAATANIVLLITIVSAFGLLLTLGLMISKMVTGPIKQAIDGLNVGTEEVSSASSQVAAASQALAEGTSEQAASVQETSSTLEETASMVNQNRENTQQAATLAKQAKQFAEQSNSEMGRMSTSMTELKNSSNEIAKIIKVIDEIAFQTNILSLNAAVEAARAGDAGKGFAVVAEEVRNLAQRSAQAAKDTAVIIESNISLSDNGVDIAKKVQVSVESIEEQAKKVSDLLDEISVATNEQAQGVEQINKAVAQMEVVLSTNAQTAEEAASASCALSEQAINVKDIVNSLIILVDGAEALQGHGGNVQRQMALSANPPRRISSGQKKPQARSTAKTVKKTQSPENVIPLNDDF